MMNSAILAMYDIRGIQDYIFKTNRAREIIGASSIVDNILARAFEDFIIEKKKQDSDGDYRSDWKNGNKNDYKDFEKNGVRMLVIYIGGGNAYVLYSDEDICEEANRHIGKYVLNNTYSLHLAVATCEKSKENFNDDYKKINDEMFKIKSKMPYLIPSGAFPFVQIDSNTGYPLTKKSLFDNNKIVCREAYLKEKAFSNLKDVDENVFDDMVPEKGNDSTLALVCMDGNNMGKRILEKFNSLITYDALVQMRELTIGIDNDFKNAFKKVEEEINDKRMYRKIILAGDDICFVCNSKVAMSAIQCFMRALKEQNNSFMADPDVPFTACAGIAFFNSHFPFSDAYKVAEACCESAKEKAKEKERMAGERIGNFIDFQLCSNVNASNLDFYRDKHYKVNQQSIINRPYYVVVDSDDEELNNNNTDCCIGELEKKIGVLNSIPRNIAKEIRAVIVQGDNEIEKEISYLNSRGIYLNTKDKNNKNNNTLREEKAVWYDACELMDFYSSKENGENENN